MRRGAMLVLVLLVGLGTLPQSVEARPRGLGAVLGVITNPVGAILGASKKAGRRVAHQRRAYAKRSRGIAPPAAVAGVAAGAAATAAVSTATSFQAATPAIESPDPAASQIKPATSNISDARPVELVAPRQSSDMVIAAQPTEAAPAPPGARPSGNAPRLGMVGPAAWPSAFEDVIGYALWPADYGERLRTHGIGDVLATAFTPGAALIARARGTARSDETKSTVGSGGPAGICGTIGATAPDWPTAELERSLTLNDAQRAALDEFKTALTKAAASIRATCRDDAAPVDRLRAMQNTLWAVHDAAVMIRAPVAKFYDSLDAEQKKKFAAPAEAQAEPRAGSRSDVARLCGMPAANELPVQQLDQSLRITRPQRASLDTLQKKTFEMGQFLMASCFKPVPATPAERLDAAADRLTAVIFAASNVNMAVNDFASQLSDEQKAKLNTFGR